MFNNFFKVINEHNLKINNICGLSPLITLCHENKLKFPQFLNSIIIYWKFSLDIFSYVLKSTTKLLLSIANNWCLPYSLKQTKKKQQIYNWIHTVTEKSVETTQSTTPNYSYLAIPSFFCKNFEDNFLALALSTF